MADEPDSGAIRPRLSTFDTAMVVFSLVVGIGIFRTPAMVASAAGGTALFFVAWIAAGIISLIGALTFAEIGSRYPRAGGYYRVVADCYRPTLAFMLNWSQTLMQGAGAAGVAFIGAEYLMPVILPPQWRTPQASLVLACTTMLILLVCNYRGVKPGALVQNLLSLLKIAMILGLALLALLLAPRLPAPTPRSAAPTGSASRVGADSLLLRLWRISIDHELGRRLEGRAAPLSARHHGRDVQRGRPVSVAEFRLSKGSRNRRHRGLEVGGGCPVARDLRTLRRGADLSRRVSVGRRIRECHHHSDAAQFLRHGAGRSAAAGVSAGQSPYSGAGGGAPILRRDACCCRRSSSGRSRSFCTM